ncbi:hypothetical protein Goshw_010376 [Gossypium schwendimanii]|uniref:Uncharacterized protein n=1 Tax=Gossypium schwendimanii TaxID=34291 RepID=A0A7J9N743_GOSSC|nr:hypothetical protein [Gossypium schwendimanii]
MKNMNRSLKKGKEKEASGSFMMKRMSFKRMIRCSCRVEPYPLFFLFKDQPFVSVFSH